MMSILCMALMLGIEMILFAIVLDYRNKYKQAMDEVQLFAKGYQKAKDDYESLKADYAVIFDNLEKDPMCLAKTDKAYMDLIDKLEVEHDLFMKVLEANLVYDRANVNYYNANTKEITISMFDNMNNEQSLFMFDYLNEKYGTNFNSKDLRTRFLFTVLHELGHCVDFSNKEKVGEFESYSKDDAEQRTIVRAMTDEIKSWKAYREIPAEMLADKFAVEQMIKYYPELAYGEKQ